MYKAVIFDLDGTLLNTIDDLAIACNYALEKCNLPTHDVEKYKQFVGNGRYKLIERIIPEEKRSEELFNKVLKLYDDYYEAHMMDETKPYNGIINLLDNLKDKNIKIAVVSNKPNEFTVGMVKHYFGERFDIIFGHREGYKTKPNPDTVLEVMKELNVKENECIYIGDSNVDMKTAQNANLKSIGVSWGFRGRKELEEAGADFVVDNVSEIEEIIIE